MNTLQEIIAIKELRRDIDVQIQKLKSLPGSAEKTLALRKLQEGVMWLGMDLKRLAEQNPEVLSIANPYPDSKDPSNALIQPTADGLKL